MALDFWCPSVAGSTGYGRVHVRLYRALKRIGAKLTDDPGAEDVTVHYGQPGLDPRLRKLWRVRPAGKFLFYSMFECSVPPEGWVDVIEGRLPGVEPADGLCVPSTWAGNMFRANGVTIPVHVVPHGVDAEEFPFVDRGIPSRPFTYLWQGVSPDDRKGGWLVREAFENLALPADVHGGPWLVLKWMNRRPFYWKDNERRIEHIGVNLSDSEMLELLRRCDVSVNPTSGEGFGLIPLEHAATGMATIVTDWSGPADYAGDVGMLRLGYELGPSVFGGQIGLKAIDAKPDENDLEELMAMCFMDEDGARDMGRRSSERIHEHWTWERAARALIDAVSEHVPRETVMEAVHA